MSDTVIQVENVSKRYIIGHQRAAGDGLRHVLEQAARAPLKWLQARRTARKATREEFWALSDINLEIKQGEAVGIIGRNGAGKSTLLKLLSRITDPTKGRIRIRGRLASLLEVGTGFHPELTGRENIFLNGAILGMSRVEIKRKFDEIVAFSEVERFLDTPVKRYSSGMYVRLAFSVAAHLEPEILVIDEVLAVGDAAFQKKCLGKMNEVARHGRTVLFVSHQLPVVQNLCTRCVLLQEGRVAKHGPTKEVLGVYMAHSDGLSEACLAERKDRRGTGDAIATAVEVLDADGKPLQSVASGMTVVLRVRYAVKPGATLKSSEVAMHIYKEGVDFITLVSELVDKHPVDLRGEGFVDFIVPDLPLSGGTYYVQTVLGRETETGLQDWVQHAGRLTVVDGDYYGTGRLYRPGWGGTTVLVKYSCRYHQD
jgi:lipopolysaccharide transport system ATP-binding protein